MAIGPGPLMGYNAASPGTVGKPAPPNGARQNRTYINNDGMVAMRPVNGQPQAGFVQNPQGLSQQQQMQQLIQIQQQQQQQMNQMQGIIQMQQQQIMQQQQQIAQLSRGGAQSMAPGANPFGGQIPGPGGPAPQQQMMDQYGRPLAPGLMPPMPMQQQMQPPQAMGDPNSPVQGMGYPTPMQGIGGYLRGMGIGNGSTPDTARALATMNPFAARELALRSGQFAYRLSGQQFLPHSNPYVVLNNLARSGY